jgi:LCP family protein required for cell wall assembly
MELVGLDPVKGRSSILGFPRDSWVNIPGHGMNKLNDAMYYGGPQGAVAEIEQLTGIHISYYVLTSFWNFRTLVHDIGGVNVDIPYAMDDSYSKAHFKPGERHLSGKQALSFARDRHDPPGGDFGRSFNCGSLLIDFLADFQQDELLQLGFLASQISLKNVNNFVVPGSTGMEGTESVVHISPSAQSYYDDLGADGYIAKG